MQIVCYFAFDFYETFHVIYFKITLLFLIYEL